MESIEGYIAFKVEGLGLPKIGGYHVGGGGRPNNK